MDHRTAYHGTFRCPGTESSIHLVNAATEGYPMAPTDLPDAPSMLEIVIYHGFFSSGVNLDLVRYSHFANRHFSSYYLYKRAVPPDWDIAALRWYLQCCYHTYERYEPYFAKAVNNGIALKQSQAQKMQTVVFLRFMSTLASPE